MIMKWLTVEQSPILVIFVVSTYFVTLSMQCCVSIERIIYIHSIMIVADIR